MEIESKERAVAQAEEDLALVAQDEVTLKVDPSYDRAVDDARRALADAEDDLADARLYAPWAGLVTRVHAVVGSTVEPGAAIVTLINLERMTFATQNLSERHIAQLGVGQRAEITLRAYPDTVLEGHIESVVPRDEVAAAEDARFVAHIRLDDTDLDLLPGMTGRVEVIADTP
jgi:multidrug resistance efflux pump